jgi:hypothetical protein
MSVELKQFGPQEIKINQDQAYQILRFIWTDIGISPQEISRKDIAFAQSLLVEAIDASYKMGYVEQLFKSFYMKVPASFGSIKDMVKNFAKGASQHWFKHATQKDLMNPQIYENVRLNIARNFRSAWSIREQTGELTY